MSSRHAAPTPKATKARRDVNITAVLVAVVIGGTAVVLAYLFVVWRIAEQGLDVRGLVDVTIGPREWGYLSGFVVAASGLLALLLRNGRIEKLLGRDIPDQVAATLSADRAATADRAGLAAAQATAAAARNDDRTLADHCRLLAAALMEALQHTSPLPEAQAELVEQLIDVLERQPATPLPPLPPLPSAPLTRIEITPPYGNAPRA